MKIEKGIISKFDKVKKFDRDGDEFSQIYLTVNNQKFFSKGPADINLSEGVTIYFERENDEIISCYAPLDGTKWGKNASALKRMSPAQDKYSFIMGKVVEKQKRTTLNTTDSAITGRSFERGVGYTIVLENGSFHAVHQFGGKIFAGDEIAAVIEDRSAVLTKNLKTGSLTGYEKPWFLVVFLFIVAINLAIFYTNKKYPGLLINTTALYAVLNSILGLFLLLKILVFLKSKRAFNYLNKQLN